MFLLQMSGFPGSGKSTLARSIAKHTGAVVIDHDVVKTALMEAMNESVNNKDTGNVSYSIEWALIDFHLSHGHSVIHDSPCFYSSMLDNGEQLSRKHGAAYKYVECCLEDMAEVNRRLQQRYRMISQIAEVHSEEGFRKRLADSKRPLDGNYLIVDTSKPVEHYLESVLEYMNDSSVF